MLTSEERIEHRRISRHKSYITHKARHDEIHREWRVAHPDEIRKAWSEASRKWRQSHPEAVHSLKRNRKARVKNAEGTISLEEWNVLKDKHGKCLSCGRTDVPLTLDHVIPLILNGPNTIDNAQPLCAPCNSKKGIRIIDYR